MRTDFLDRDVISNLTEMYPDVPKAITRDIYIDYATTVSGTNPTDAGRAIFPNGIPHPFGGIAGLVRGDAEDQTSHPDLHDRLSGLNALLAGDGNVVPRRSLNIPAPIEGSLAYSG